MSVSSAFIEHVDELERRALAGDDFATRTLCAMVLLREGWRPGDPDPDGPDGGEFASGDNIIDFRGIIDLRGRLAA